MTNVHQDLIFLNLLFYPMLSRSKPYRQNSMRMVERGQRESWLSLARVRELVTKASSKRGKGGTVSSEHEGSLQLYQILQHISILI